MYKQFLGQQLAIALVYYIINVEIYFKDFTSMHISQANSYLLIPLSLYYRDTRLCIARSQIHCFVHCVHKKDVNN